MGMWKVRSNVWFTRVVANFFSLSRAHVSFPCVVRLLNFSATHDEYKGEYHAICEYLVQLSHLYSVALAPALIAFEYRDSVCVHIRQSKRPKTMRKCYLMMNGNQNAARCKRYEHAQSIVFLHLHKNVAVHKFTYEPATFFSVYRQRDGMYVLIVFFPAWEMHGITFKFLQLRLNQTHTHIQNISTKLIIHIFFWMTFHLLSTLNLTNKTGRIIFPPNIRQMLVVSIYRTRFLYFHSLFIWFRMWNAEEVSLEHGIFKMRTLLLH